MADELQAKLISLKFWLIKAEEMTDSPEFLKAKLRIEISMKDCCGGNQLLHEYLAQTPSDIIVPYIENLKMEIKRMEIEYSNL